MAKRKTKAKKRYPVQRATEIRTFGNDDNKLIDVPKMLSMLNHRLYRQSRVYRAKINHMNRTEQQTSFPNGFTVEVYALRDTWMLQKAYQLAKSTYDKNTAEERARLGSKQTARWEDFRIVADLQNGGTEMRPYVTDANTLAGSLLNSGEHVASQVVDESGVSRAFGLFASASRYSILQEYDNTANTEVSPDTTIASSNLAYGELDNDAQADSMEDLQTHGNNPPYDATGLESSNPFVKVGEIGHYGDKLVSTTGFFDAPLGIIYVRYTDGRQGGAGAANIHLELEVANGDYKGVHAVNYLE